MKPTANLAFHPFSSPSALPSAELDELHPSPIDSGRSKRRGIGWVDGLFRTVEVTHKVSIFDFQDL